jgi:hypothetical protein
MSSFFKTQNDAAPTLLRVRKTFVLTKLAQSIKQIIGREKHSQKMKEAARQQGGFFL